MIQSPKRAVTIWSKTAIISLCNSTDPDAFDASPGDLLTVVELNALQTVAALQVLQCDVSDEGAVVQLNHGEALLPTGAAAQSSDAIVCDQFAVGQGLQSGLKTHR